ncbi:MAG TPA: MFS transporter [Caulobacteraceae bacterium]|jgi:MFS family permease
MTDVASVPGQTKTGQVYLYFAPLTFLIFLSAPVAYLVDFSTTFMLKNQLHATANSVTVFRLITGIPAYVAFIFGMTRDWWNPFGLRDRGYLMIFAPLTAAVFIWMAFTPLSYTGLLIGMFLAMTTSGFLAAAFWGLMALVGQEKLMSGRLSALWNIVTSIPYIAGALAGGWVADHLKPSETFMAVAVMTLAVGAFGIWRPAAVYEGAYDKPNAQTKKDILGDLKRLVKHKAIYAPILMIFMFQFAPGSNTPLQYYLTNQLHAPDAFYGYYYAIFVAAFIPVFFLYAWLCKRVTLEKLLWWGLIITVPQMVPLAFIHSGVAALWLALPIGMLGGVAAAAIYDLAMRACPPGLQGTMMMFIAAGNLLSYRGGDWLGVQMYDASPTHGFVYCVIATTVVYALIVPVILLVPKHVMNTTDGEANPVLAAQAMAEIAEPSIVS